MLKKLLLVLVTLVASIGMAFAAVNINTATEQELQTLPGVGPAKAKAIIDYRTTKGNFKTVDDLKNVKGIGDKTFDKFKGQLTVSEPTQLDPKAQKAAPADKAGKKDAAAPAATAKDAPKATQSPAATSKKK
ncbi:ComEA family DNA-binding protein [Uliginosibacterium gangwonense]|uniref:ComEA family DNA-binding protein n=1 Tax=Uliginosibacterium gangwonense TaxID=392736 RepID=UPI000380777F|nr:helix-hairpin-helix domain-containing protein [Uliginosibacterium gangwonense]